MTLEDRPAAAISLHVAVAFLAALTVLAESRDDATGVAVTASTKVQTVGETVGGDDTAGGGHWLSNSGAVLSAMATVLTVGGDVGQRLLDTCKRLVVGRVGGVK